MWPVSCLGRGYVVTQELEDKGEQGVWAKHITNTITRMRIYLCASCSQECFPLRALELWQPICVWALTVCGKLHVFVSVCEKEVLSPKALYSWPVEWSWQSLLHHQCHLAKEEVLDRNSSWPQYHEQTTNSATRKSCTHKNPQKHTQYEKQ